MEKPRKKFTAFNIAFLKSLDFIIRNDILNNTGDRIFDDRIVKIETHTYNPYTSTTFEHSNEIRISIQQQDLYTLSYESFLYLERRLIVKKKNNQMLMTLGNNCIMFDEIRYSTMWRLTVTETLELPISSRITY